jgi:hypothetical protein
MESSKPPTVSFLFQKLSFPNASLSGNLIIPHLDTIGESHQLKPSISCISILGRHIAFRRFCEPALSIEVLRRQAKGELTAITSTFPSVSDGQIVLAMAAWFFHLCAMDDLVEEMSLHAAQRALVDAVGILKRRKRVSVDWTRRRVGGVVVHRRRSSYYDVDSHLGERVRYITETFRQHLRSLLSVEAYTRVSRDICNVLAAVSAESDFRHRKRQDLAAYLEIRRETIGLAPFFTLLRLSHDTSAASYSAPSQFSLILQTHISTLVGYQNDLIGLEKDLAGGEWMNCIVISSSRQDINNTEGSVEEAIETAIKEHNCASKKVLECWESIKREGREDLVLAGELIEFAERHLQWAVGARRYKD